METDGGSYWPFAVVTLYELVRDDLWHPRLRKSGSVAYSML